MRCDPRTHHRSIWILLGCALGLALAVSLHARAPRAQPADDGAALQRAGDFARLFLEGKHEQARDLMDGAMRNLLDPESSAEIVARLTEANGPVREIGEAWFEDTVQFYRRYRVPVTFERGRLDLRVVIGRTGEVAGLFVVEPIEPPALAAGPAPAPPAEEIEVSIGPSPRALPGSLTLPRARPCPAVLLVHGSGPQDRDESVGPNKPFRDLAWGLARHGIATLRYDKRSFVHPEQLQALGDALTVKEEVIDDAVDALRYLASRSDIDPERIYLLGHSLGGNLAPRIAAAGIRPAGLILMAANARPLTSLIIDQTRYIYMVDGEVTLQEQLQMHEIEKEVYSIRNALIGEAEPPEGYILGAPFGYWQDLEAYDGPAAAADLGLPTLVLQGKRDYQVTREDFELWVAALSTYPEACFVTYDALDHLFRSGEGQSTPEDYQVGRPVDDRVIDDIAGWILDAWCP